MDAEIPRGDTSYTNRNGSTSGKRVSAVEYDGLPSETGLLAAYLRELRGTEPVDKETELTSALELGCARESYAALIAGLPIEHRYYVLEEDTADPKTGASWPLARIEACHRRLLRIDPAPDAAILQRAIEIKRRIDRARDDLILPNQRLVAHVAKQFVNRNVPLIDLIQEGNIGLMRAVDRFDHERGYKFATYAVWWIRQAISKAIVDKSRLIRLPEHVRESVREMNGIRRELHETLGRRPSAPEIAERMRVRVAKVERLQSIVRDPQPLEATSPEDDSMGVIGVIADEAVPTPLECTLNREMKRRVLAALSSLSPREEQIIRLRFGLNNGVSHTLRDIGKQLNLTRERVRQIERNALAKIYELAKH
jgi:RNA polymerase sigma factor (sigma-70 family)